MRTFSGAWPALLTPLTTQDTVSVSVLRGLTDYLIDRGVSGFYVCGGTGQGVHLSVAERKLVVEQVVEQVNGRLPVITHVGSQVLGDAIELASHAQTAGADGISSIIPAGYTDIETVSQYFGAVAGAVPDIPFLPYLFTSSFDPVGLMRAIKDVPNLAGTKYTGPNMYQFRQILEEGGGSWSVFSGMDEQCVFAAMLGSCGNIGSTLNAIPGIYQKMHASCHAGDPLLGRDLQLQANRVTETLFRFGFPGALRAATAMLGYDCGPPRLPAQPLPDDQRQPLESQLESVGFSEIASM